MSVVHYVGHMNPFRKTATYTTTDEWTGVVTVHAFIPLTRREARKAAALMAVPVTPIAEEW